MAPPPTNSYDSKKAEVKSKIQNKEYKGTAQDLYLLAALLAQFRPKDSLPVCLLCHSVAEGNFPLGHLTPKSILKQDKAISFADLNRGKQIGVSTMGYRAFCQKCEQRFSCFGEVHFTEKLFLPFFENQDEAIEKVEVVEKCGLSWLYFVIISIVWRNWCFIPNAGGFTNTLEYLREFLLEFPSRTKNIDEKVALFIFAMNSKVQSNLENDSETLARFFNNMYFADFSFQGGAWIFLGPMHFLMVYNDKGIGELKGLFPEDELTQAESCRIKSTDKTISIANKEERFFPMAMYEPIIYLGLSCLSKLTRIPSPEENVNLQLPPVPATELPLLPSDCIYEYEDFLLPGYFEKTFHENIIGTSIGTIVGARRTQSRNKERIVFVALKRLVNGVGPLTMALNVNANEKVSYLQGVHVPPSIKLNGTDLSEIPFKELIEDIIRLLIIKGKAKW